MARRPAGRRPGSRGSAGSRSGGERSRADSRRGGGRSGGRGGRGGGGSNATAIGVGVVLVIGVVAIILIAGGGKKKTAPVEYTSEELTAESGGAKTAAGPVKPERPPPPKISEEIIQNAKTLLEEATVEQEQGDALYDEAMAARRDGDEKTWQTKLAGAREHYITIRNMWNEQIENAIEGELPADCEWDAAEVANYWLGKEASKMSKMLDRLGAITKQTRMK